MIADKSINLDTLHKVLFDNEKLELSEECIRKVEESFDFLQSFSSDKIIYGINTGFGPMAQYRIEDQSLIDLQYNIIRSHSTGAGKPLPELYVKAAMIARLYTFLQGKSGVHLELVSLLCEFINRGIYPFIPEHGSVGASGDLVQLAHIALTLIGEGEVFYQGKLCNAATVLQENGLKPFSMRIREGLSVTNGTSVMTGIGIVNLIYAKKLLRWSVAASVMMNEIAASYDDFMAQALNEAKHHKGQQEIAAMMREWVAGSKSVLQRENELYNQVHKEKIFEHKVQPYYSLRCVPQILGPIYDELENAEEVLINEINSACDNPIVDPDTRNIYHGGNFHGDYISFEMDKLNAKGGTCFFLGSSEDTLRKIKVKAVRLYPNIRVETYSPPYKPEFTQEDNQAMIAAVNRAQPDLLWVGMTAPKQEKWTYTHLKELEVNGPIGTIGAVFDFFAENVQRAPVWWQEHGLEWLYRLIKEPKRMWRRYIIGNCLFLWNITKEKFTS